ncbi:MAG: hypothetical protein AAFY91_13545, partial [Bacteroidota bacterium]
MLPDIANGISSVISMIPFPGKFTFIPLSQVSPIPLPSGLPYTLMFNPDHFEETTSLRYFYEQPPGSGDTQLKFRSVKSPSFNLEFTIDGTGASGEKKEVELAVADFKSLFKVDGEKHEPPTILAVWGTFFSVCKLLDFSVKYTMFRANGTPLRAKISARFHGHTERVLELLKMNLLSPDLTKLHNAVEGDTLPLLANREYEDPRFFVQLARAND